MPQREIQELNLTYLMMAQRILSHDRDTGIFKLQLTEDMADYLLSLSSSQLARLAKVNQCLFQLRFHETDKLKKLTHNQREHGMAQTHAALLLASTLPLSA